MNQRFFETITFLLIATILCSIPRATAAQKSPINDVHVIHFVLDGLSYKAFEKALAQDRVPTLRQHFIDGGATFTHAISGFPSTSTTIYQSFVTGLFPGHAGIPHLERFDRKKQEVIGYLTPKGAAKINSDLINLRALLNPDVVQIEPPTTIFELLKGYPTAAVYSSFSRGASYVHPKKAPIRALWSTYVTEDIHKVDVLAMRKILDLYQGDFEKIPRYTLAGLYSSDISGHHFGPMSDEVQDALHQFDLFLAEFLELLQKRGLYNKTYIIISADHGMHESGDLFHFQKALEKKGIVTKPKNPRSKNYTIYTANRGVVSSHLYIRHNGGFAPIDDPQILRHHPVGEGNHIDLIDLILSLDATDLLIVRAGNQKVQIFNGEWQSADIACTTINLTDYCSYRFDRTKGDPLGYSKEPDIAKLLDDKPHSTYVWREATAGKYYPDGIIQLSQIFHDSRAGDAFITTRGRFGFRKVKAGNHGGPAIDDMHIPLVIRGPSVPHATFSTARSVDIYPLLLKWFGLRVPSGNYDGINPFTPAPHEDPAVSTLAALELLLETKPPLIKVVAVSDFVRKEVLPIAKPAEFRHLKKIAQEELGRRAKLIQVLSTLLTSLETQEKNRDAPQITDPLYLADHIEIVRRMKEDTRQSIRVMEDISSILKNCANSAAISCRGL